MKNILILGVSGMAGHLVYTQLNKNYNYKVLGTTNSNNFGATTIKLDVFDKKNLIEIINQFKPDYVINCIGMLIQGSKKSPENTIYLNTYLPHLLDKLSVEHNFKFIHISTDCVFSGKDGAYLETSIKDAEDLYGQSKALGEIINDRNLTIRTSIIGPELKAGGEGLFHWLMNQKENVYGYKSNFWSGVTTLELANFIDYTINNDLTGLVHLTNNVPISKFSLLKIINNIYDLNLEISDKKDYKCNKSFINTNKLLQYQVPSYEEMILKQKEYMDSNAAFYSHYSLYK